MKRFKHSLSHYKLASFDMGELIPVACFEVLPGDTVQQYTSTLIRVSPLLAPVMHPVTVRIHHWFVPHRLVWSQWDDFITGGKDGLGDGAVYPTITAGGGGFASGALMDYLGIPPSVANVVASALPVRSYNLIYNEYYRDQDLVTELAVPVAGGADATSPLVLQKIAWEKDYFTAARPWTQKGSEVTLPLGTTAPVTRVSNAAYWDVYKANGDVKEDTASNVAASAAGRLQRAGGAVDYSLDPRGGLVTDLSTATAASVNDIREAFALQRYKEARALYGSRYTEYLRYLGVQSADSRLQRPEYLGGGKQTISFSEVLQTGQDFDANAGVGRLRGHGIAALRSRRYRRFFEEHGLVITLMSVRPRTMYATAMDRMWNRRTKEDYWQKELENIGQQEIRRREIYAEAGAGGDTIFGYADRYSEYRHVNSNVSAEFRSSLLNFWHLARILAAPPTLNQSFIECDASKRVHAVQTNDVLWAMINHSIQARRMVSKVPQLRIV